MKYEVEDMKSKISLVIHSVAGISMGYVSMLIGNPLQAAGVAIGVLVVIGYLVEFLVKKKGMKWWFSNGGFLYILFWIVFWTFFYNYTVVGT
ncbi:MAG: hypothetical protein GXO64_02605 [Candidatus Micrarchaeota archaeon]|nr:hypothetical protein [Candidatus Micrarchaeota archaeon]